MNPVFLIGAERSGTTLLRLMLNGHPRISWLNEFEYSVDFVNESDSWPDITKYIDYLSLHRIFQATGFTIDERLDYPELIQSFLLQKQQRDNKPLIGATCHRHYDRLLRLFPQARFMYLLRDPRDVARSNIGMGWAGNVWTGVDRWIEAEELWENVKKRLDKQTWIEIRSEELICEPERTLTTICNFLKLEYDPKMMEYPDHTTYSKPDPTLTEQWRRKLSSDEISLVEAKTYDLMKKRGYSPQSLMPPEVSLGRQLVLQVQDKICRVRCRVKRFGFWLVLADFLARRLKIRPLQKRIQLILNEKTKKFLK
jgi:hypothetical protein